MLNPLTIFSRLWDTIDPQKNLDKHCDKISKAKISQKLRERLLTTITLAKIVYGIWILILLTQVITIAGNYLGKP